LRAATFVGRRLRLWFRLSYGEEFAAQEERDPVIAPLLSAIWTSLLAPGLSPSASIAENLQKITKFLQQALAFQCKILPPDNRKRAVYVGWSAQERTQAAELAVSRRVIVVTLLRSVNLNLWIVEILQRCAEKFNVWGEAPTDKARR
jgi:hypothetical protein